MIELTFNTFFLVYLGVTIAVVLGIWIFTHYRSRKRTFFTSEKDLFVCEYCHFAYVEEGVKKLNRCPQCGLINKENTFREKKIG